MSAAIFADVETELARWRDAGLQPRIWLRDDDATRPSAALDRLLALSENAALAPLLAVIPKPCSRELPARLAAAPRVRVAVHGFAHVNHAAPDAKSTELTENGAGRDVATVIGELKLARSRLDALFGDRLSGILVPPWNRISPAVAATVDRAGFTAVSIFAWQASAAPLPHLNAHVDFIDWRGGRVGHRAETIAPMLAARLGEARLRGGAPVGLLTHHLAHDETAWRSLTDAVEFLARQGDATFASAEDCLPPPPGQA